MLNSTFQRASQNMYYLSRPQKTARGGAGGVGACGGQAEGGTGLTPLRLSEQVDAAPGMVTLQC